MLLDVSQVLRKPDFVLDFEENIQIPDSEFKKYRIKFKEPLKMQGKVKNIGGVIVLEGKAECRFEGICDRCGKSTDKAIFFSVVQEFVKSSRIESEEADAVILQDEKIDLCDLALKNVFVNIPSKILCKDDCRGICLKCGADLNQEPCTCGEEDGWNPQFEVLKGLFD